MPLPEIDRSVELFSLPGHDRDCARAMLSQARLRGCPLDDLQVAHLISIGYSAGVAAGVARGRTAAATDIRTDMIGRSPDDYLMGMSAAARIAEGIDRG
jgi:hypothetical protein